MVFIVVVGAVWLAARRSPDRSAAATSFLFASGPSTERYVSLSPDGTLAVYAVRSADPDEPGNNLFVKAVGGGEGRRLTRTPAGNRWPRWSPDGASVAFARVTGGAIEIFVIPAAGGEELKVARLAHQASISDEDVNWVAWSADSKSLIVVDRVSPSQPFALYELSLAGQIGGQITHPPAGSIGDIQAAASPDGRSLAFVRSFHSYEADLFVMSLGSRSTLRLTSDNLPVYGIAWTTDSRDVLFSSTRMSAIHTLWRAGASGTAPPSRVGGVIDASVWPSVAGLPGNAGLRIAYQSARQTVNMMRVNSSPGAGGRPAAICPSTRRDWFAQISPDGRRVAFASTRDGSANVWVCESDSVARKITSFLGSIIDSPRWSPDGRRIAFTAHQNGSREVFVADLDTGQSWPITSEPSDEGRASFSHDGRWIYFRSNRSRRNEIWRVSVSGGPALQITKTGAMEGFESLDGKRLYFTRNRPQLGVWSVLVDGGDEVHVVDGVRDTRWAVTREGIYFVTTGVPYDVMLYRFDTRKTERVYRVPNEAPIWAGFSASGDGTSFIWSQTVVDSSDLAILDSARR